MPSAFRFGLTRVLPSAILALALAFSPGSTAFAQRASMDEILSGVVKLKTFINPDGTTVENLGREREGSGIVIDDKGLILTIGYLMLEAHAAEITASDGRSVPANVVGYDHETGYGLLRAMSPIKARPMEFGTAASVKEGDPVIAAAFGGREGAAPVRVVSKREFAGSWEYVLDEAIFTSPPHPAWSGAALINREGKLVGVGHLIVGDADTKGTPGNMFVPIDKFLPISEDLIRNGTAVKTPKPWLGISTVELRGRLMVSSVTPGGPAERAGMQKGDTIISINGEIPKNLADFYRKIWAQGEAGVVVPLEVMQQREKRRFELRSMNRLDRLKLKSTF